jgi:acyl-CoA synthetase (AMP-forming)/AMP-acid ligase II
MAVIDFFDKGWQIDPGAVAYRSADESWTYDQARRMSCRIANALLDNGVERETPIAVLAPNSALAWICVLGAWRAGAAVVPLNPHSPAADNAALIARFDVRILFYDQEFADDIAEIRQTTAAVQMVALDENGADISLEQWLDGQPDVPPMVSYAMDDVVFISPTGGTTGTPKGVMNTHRSISTMVVHQMLALHYEPHEPIVNLAAAPMTHTAGLLTLQTTARGGCVVIISRAAPDLILSAIRTYRVTDLFLPPTVIYRLLDVLDREQADTSSLKYLIYGAAPMSVDKLAEGITRIGPVFIQIYGQTEAPAGISFLRPAEHLCDGAIAAPSRLSSCGRPSPLVSVSICDPDTAIPLPTGSTGEIRVAGDLLMKGYYKDPTQTAVTLRDGWLYTGDLGHLDEQGYLHITDRKKDMIISGGFNVYPNEVEQVIWSHPAVEDCAVVGAPDDDWGERVTAVVELKPGEIVTADDIITMCRDQLAGVRTPKQVIFVDELPRSVNGKVLKKDVRLHLWSDSGRAI